MKPNICLILPTYNEAENISFIINSIFDQQKKISSYDLHILVVDDNSPDGTGSIVQKLMEEHPNLHLISGEKKGLGEAYKRGMGHALKKLSPDLIFEMDADGQHDSNLIPLFVTLADHGFSLVIGSRFAPGGETPDFSLRRKIISLVGNWMIRFLGGIPRIKDCTSGFRCIKADLIPKCNLNFLSTRGYSFQSSLLCELLRNGAKVIEVPIVFPDRKYGISKLCLNDQIEFLLNIGKMRFRHSEEFFKFSIVGFSGLFINLGLYVIQTRLFNIDYRLAAPLAIETSILTNFLINHNWTFKKRENDAHFFKKLYKFHLVSAAAGLFNYVTFLSLIFIFKLNDIFANFIGIFVGTIINYSMNSKWTWREIEKKSGRFQS